MKFKKLIFILAGISVLAACTPKKKLMTNKEKVNMKYLADTPAKANKPAPPAPPPAPRMEPAPKPAPPQPGQGMPLQAPKERASNTTTLKLNKPVFKVAEEMPRFPGCEDLNGDVGEKKECADKQMLAFVYRHINITEEMIEEGIEGNVVVSFVVTENGDLSSIEVIRSLSAATDEESLRVVRLMREMEEKWIPGRIDDKPVSIQFLLPIQFKF